MATNTPGARPPIFLWFLNRVIGWNILVWGCALPLMIATWARAEPGGRLGEVCGVAAWTIGVVARAERLRSRGFVGASPALRSGAVVSSRRLRSGTVAFLVLQGLAAAVLPTIGFFLVYAPALWLATRLPLIPAGATFFHGHLVLTMVCGGQAYACALALGHLVERVRPWVERMVQRPPRPDSGERPSAPHPGRRHRFVRPT